MFLVTPNKQNPDYTTIKEGIATVWVRENNSEKAKTLAQKHVSEGYWDITAIQRDAQETTLSHYHDRPEGEICYLKSQIHGISSFVAATGVSNPHGINPPSN